MLTFFRCSQRPIVHAYFESVVRFFLGRLGFPYWPLKRLKNKEPIFSVSCSFLNYLHIDKKLKSTCKCEPISSADSESDAWNWISTDSFFFFDKIVYCWSVANCLESVSNEAEIFFLPQARTTAVKLESPTQHCAHIQIVCLSVSLSLSVSELIFLTDRLILLSFRRLNS